MVPRTYRAMLRGDHVEWIDRPPPLEADTRVEITFPHPESGDARRMRHRAAAAALRELTEAGGISAISDPAAWEREIRVDRPLPRPGGG